MFASWLENLGNLRCPTIDRASLLLAIRTPRWTQCAGGYVFPHRDNRQLPPTAGIIATREVAPTRGQFSPSWRGGLSRLARAGPFGNFRPHARSALGQGGCREGRACEPTIRDCSRMGVAPRDQNLAQSAQRMGRLREKTTRRSGRRCGSVRALRTTRPQADTEGGLDDADPKHAHIRAAMPGADSDRRQIAIACPHSLDDPPRHARGARHRARQLRVPLVRRRLHPLPAPAQLHRHGRRARRARRRLHDLRAAQDAAAHPELRRGRRVPPPRRRPADDRQAGRQALQPAPHADHAGSPRDEPAGAALLQERRSGP